MPRSTKLQRALDEMGSCERDIFFFLTDQGVKGHHAKGECPVANFLKLRGVKGAVIEAGGFMDGDEQAHVVVKGRKYPLSAHLTQFIHNFDNGSYPDLLDRKW